MDRVGNASPSEICALFSNGIRLIRFEGPDLPKQAIWHETFLPLGTTKPVPSYYGVERRLRAFASRNRDGACKRPVEFRLLASRVPPVVDSQLDAAWRTRRSGVKAESHQWVNSDSTGLEARRAGTDGIHGVRMLLGNERSKGKRRHPFHDRGRAAKGRSCGFF